jgi:ribonuclease PH
MSLLLTIATSSVTVTLSTNHSCINDIKDVIECHSCMIIEEECFLNLPSNMDEDNPLDLEKRSKKSKPMTTCCRTE